MRDYARFGRCRLQSRADSRQRLAYIGDPGCGNVGDDCMYLALQEALPQFAFPTFGSPRQERLGAAMRLGGSRYLTGVMLGGGTLISAYPYWIEQTEAALSLGLPLWAIGTGVGSAGYELAPDVDLRAWKPLLPQFRRVGVRGPRSLAALAAMGVTGNTEVVGDLALCLARPGLVPLSDPPSFAVNLALPNMADYGHGEYAAFQGLEVAARTLCRAGWRCRPVAMHPSDVLPLTRFLAAIGISETPYLPPNADALLRFLAPCHFTAAVRLHAAVLSCCAGVPPLMLGYRDKCLDFMESMTLSDWHLALQSAGPAETQEKTLSIAAECGSLRLPTLAQSQHWQTRLASYLQQIAAETSPQANS